MQAQDWTPTFCGWAGAVAGSRAPGQDFPGGSVVPLHHMVPNPYTLLSEIPEQAKYFSVIDLKGAF